MLRRIRCTIHTTVLLYSTKTEVFSVPFRHFVEVVDRNGDMIEGQVLILERMLETLHVNNTLDD